jgi:hypothetical protein
VLTAGAEFPRRRFTGTRRSRRSGVTAGLLACGLAVEYEHGMGNPLVGSGRGGIGRRGWLAVTGGSGTRRRHAITRSRGLFTTRSSPGGSAQHGKPSWALVEVDLGSVKVERQRRRLGTADNAGERRSGCYG